MDLKQGKRVSAREAEIPDALAELEGLIDVSAFFMPPGIYFLYLGDQLQYIGQSVEPSARIIQHKKKGKKFDRVMFLPTPRHELLKVESELIKKHRPPLNGLPSPHAAEKNPILDRYMDEMRERDLKPYREKLAAKAAADPQYKLFERRRKGANT